MAAGQFGQDLREGGVHQPVSPMQAASTQRGLGLGFEASGVGSGAPYRGCLSADRQRLLSKRHIRVLLGTTLFPIIMEVDEGFPNRKVVLQNPSVSFHDCWRKGTYWLLRRWLDLGNQFGHVLRGRGKTSL